MNSFNDLIRKDFDFLFDKYSFRFIDNHEKELMPSYGIAIAEGENLRIRFISNLPDVVRNPMMLM